MILKIQNFYEKKIPETTTILLSPKRLRSRAHSNLLPARPHHDPLALSFQ